MSKNAKQASPVEAEVSPTDPVEIEVNTTDPVDFQVEELTNALETLQIVPHKVKRKVKTVKTSVGAEILVHIAKGELSNKEILAAVLEGNPKRKTTYACVAWYQSKVKVGLIDLPQVEEEDQEEV